MIWFFKSFSQCLKMFIDSESFVSHGFCPGLIAELTHRCDLRKCLSRAGAHSNLILALDYNHTAN